MAVVFFSGFDWTEDPDNMPFLSSTAFTTPNKFLQRYSYGNSLSFSRPRSTVGTIDFGVTSDELYYEFDAHTSIYQVDDEGFISFYDEDGNVQIRVKMTSEDGGGNFNVSFNSGSSGGSVLAGPTTGYPMTVAAWNHLGIYIKIHATTGAIILKVDGVELLNVSGIDTETLVGKQMRYFNMHRPGFNGTYSMDNLIIMDTTGSKDKGFKGPGRVYAQLVDADGVVSNFTPSAGSNYQNVDELNPDGDTTYNESSTSTHRDSFATPTWSGLIDSGLDIIAVQVGAVARKTDASAISLDTYLRSNGANYDASGAEALDDSYTVLAQCNFPINFWTEDPDDVAAWNLTKLNALEFGYTIP